MMTTNYTQSVLTFIAGALFIFAGLRDFFMQGFLCPSSHHDTNGTGELISGRLFLLPGFLFWKRSKRIAGAQPWLTKTG
jgi:hypothetical protein